MADDAGDVSPEELETVDELTDFDDEAEEAGEEEDDNPYQESDEALPDDEEEAALETFNRRDAGDSRHPHLGRQPDRRCTRQGLAELTADDRHAV